MKTFNFVSGALAASLVVASSFAAFAQGGIGSVTVSGPAQIDGQNASSGGSLGAAARLSTGDGGTAVVTLAGGGELRLEGQSDVIVALSGNGVRVHLLCGKATLTSTGASTLYSTMGGRVTAITGSTSVTTDGKAVTIKTGKHDSRDSDTVIWAAVDGGSQVSLESRIQCNCNCK